jgi:hypothetical protein
MLTFILLTTYMVERAFNVQTDIVTKPVDLSVHSTFVDKVISLGNYELFFNRSGELIYISQGGNRYEVELNSPVLLETHLTQLETSLEAKHLDHSLYFKTIDNKIIISSSTYFDLTLLERNDGQNSPFYMIEGQGAVNFDEKSFKAQSQNFVLERNKKTDIAFINNQKSVDVFYSVSPRHHSVKITKTRYIEFYIGNESTINGFEVAKSTTDLFVSKIVEYILINLVVLFDSKLAAVLFFLLIISLVTFPLEKFILTQNNRLDSVKPYITTIKNQFLSSEEQTKKIQGLYQTYGVRSLLAPLAFFLKIVLMIFAILALLNSDAIKGMSFAFINDFHKVGDGWFLVWILPILFLMETKLKGTSFFDSNAKKHVAFLVIYTVLSIFLITPLIVLIIIHFTVIKLIALLLEKINSTPKEKIYATNIS